MKKELRNVKIKVIASFNIYKSFDKKLKDFF